MMASERPAVPPAIEAQEPHSNEATPPPETPTAPPPFAAPAPLSTLQPSPFLNGFDLVLVLGTIVLGFGLASFSVRNADFWMHLGTGKAIAEGGLRSRVAIATKAGLEWRDGKVFRNASRDRIMREIEDSLRRLRTDHIEIYQVH